MGRTVKGIHLDPHRGYRERCAPRDGEHGFQLVIGETDLRVTAVSPLPEGFKDALAARVRTLRGELEAWIVLHPEFRHSLVPVPLSCSAPPPEIVRRMTEASAIAGVGPFAAVAGTIAQMAAESLVDRSPDLIIELNVAASACPLALCASSATIGHSLSFGQGELVLVRSPDGALADALATALCNRLQGPGDVKAVVGYARRFVKHGLTGIFAQCGGAIGVWGDMELTAVEQDS